MFENALRFDEFLDVENDVLGSTRRRHKPSETPAAADILLSQLLCNGAKSNRLHQRSHLTNLPCLRQL